MKANFSENLEDSKRVAEDSIKKCFSTIEQQLVDSADIFRKAGQRVQVEVDAIVEALRAGKTEWLAHMGIIFDSSIIRLKNKLHELNSQDYGT